MTGKEKRMNKYISFPGKIKNDLAESRITLGNALLFIPVGFLTFLFHESGHWMAGELLGEQMVLSLNNAAPCSGYYAEQANEVFILAGGPAFTLLQAVISWIVIEKTKSIYVYPFVIFAAFCRFFSLVFGGFSRQDEAKIAYLLNIWPYTVALVVLSALFLVAWRSSKVLNLNLKALGYYIVLCTISILLVIGVNTLIR
jgi:hypothetical protein